MLFTEYMFIFKYFAVCFFFVFFLFFFPFFLVFQKPDSEKLSSYECGFNPYGDARVKFDVHFYLVAILFMIFDLEMAFLFPFVVILGKLNFFGILSLFFFVFVLMLGFCYEWMKGALEWI